MRARRQFGYSMIELMATMSVALVLIGIASFNFKATENPAYNGASELLGNLKKIRARALVSTKAYLVKPTSSTRIIAQSGANCSTNTWTTESQFTLNLENGAYLPDTTWSICYSARGLSDVSASVLVRDATHSKTVEIVLGGAVRLL